MVRLILTVLFMGSFALAAPTTTTVISNENVIDIEDDVDVDDLADADYDVEGSFALQAESNSSGDGLLFGAGFFFRPGISHRLGFRAYLPTSTEKGSGSYIAEGVYRYLLQPEKGTLFFEPVIGLSQFRYGNLGHVGLAIGAIRTIGDVSIGGTAGFQQTFGDATDFFPRLSAFVGMEI